MAGSLGFSDQQSAISAQQELFTANDAKGRKRFSREYTRKYANQCKGTPG
jgi:hypothetical protein